MPSFFRSLVKLFNPDRPPTRAAYVAAFGKHPGWDDHIDDLGLETERLVQFKRMLYLEGLQRNIDSGAWEALSAGQRIDGFRHAFLWLTGGAGDEAVVGRFWSSSD